MDKKPLLEEVRLHRAEILIRSGTQYSIVYNLILKN